MLKEVTCDSDTILLGEAYIHSPVNSNNQQSRLSIELRKGIETHETNSNVEKYAQTGVSNITRRLQSLTRKLVLCKINDKSQVTI